MVDMGFPILLSIAHIFIYIWMYVVIVYGQLGKISSKQPVYLSCGEPVINGLVQNCINSIAIALGPRGGYSLYVGWYGCAAVLTPFFDILRLELDLFGVFFLIHQHQNDLLGY